MRTATESFPIRLLAVTVAGVGLLQTSCTTTTQADNVYSMPTEKTKHSILDSELKRLQTNVSEYPKRHDFHYKIAGIYFQQQKYRESMDALDAALALDPDESKYHYHAGRVYLRMGELDKAEGHFRTATEHMQADRYTGPHAALGYVLARERRMDEAITEFEKCIEIEPENPEFYYFLGSLYDVMGEDDRTIHYYREYLVRGGTRYQENAVFILERLGVEVSVGSEDADFGQPQPAAGGEAVPGFGQPNGGTFDPGAEVVPTEAK